MGNISTTIKKIYMDKILSGEKTSEYKANTPFWNKRLIKYINRLTDEDPLIITFLCGQKSYKYYVKDVICVPLPMVIDGKKVDCYWEIQLGKKVGQ